MIHTLIETLRRPMEKDYRRLRPTWVYMVISCLRKKLTNQSNNRKRGILYGQYCGDLT